MKKILKFGGIFVAAIILALLVAPMFYSLDDLRPKIEEVIKKNVRGEVKLGKLSLSLFPSISIGVDDIQLISPEVKNKNLGSLKSVELKMSLLSLLASPKATLTLNDLKLEWIKDETKSLDNLAAFLLPPPKDAEVMEQNKAVAKSNKAEDIAEILGGIPGFLRARIVGAKFSFELNDAQIVSNLKFKDGLHLEESLSNFDFDVSDIGLDSLIKIKGSTDVVAKGAGVTINGLVEMAGTTKVSIDQATGVVSAEIDIRKDLAALEIKALDLMHKQKGSALAASSKGLISYGNGIKANLKELNFEIGGIKTTGSLDLTMPDEGPENFSLSMLANGVELSSFSALFPFLRSYSLGGTLNYKIGIAGDFKDPKFSGNVSFSGVKGSTPELSKPISNGKGQVVLGGSLSSPKININNSSINIGKSDLGLSATIEGIKKINIGFAVNSKLIDLDELMLAVDSAATTSSVPAGGTAKTAGTPAKAAAVNPNASLDQSLEDMAPMIEEALSNEMLDSIKMDGKVNFKEIKFMGASYKDASLAMGLANRKMNINAGGMKAYGGGMDAVLSLGLQPKAFSYSMNAMLNNIAVEKALAAHAPKWQKDVTGNLKGIFNISGIGLLKKDLEKHLKGSLRGELTSGTLNIPVLKVINEVFGKLPDIAKGKTGKIDNQNFNGAFKTAKVDSEIVGRQVQLKNLDVIYDTQKGKLGDMRFQGNGTINFDKAIDLTAVLFMDPKIINRDELLGPSGQIEFPLKLKGTMDEPKPDYGYTTKILVERASKGAAKKIAKKQIQKVLPKIEEKINEKVKNPEVKKQINNLKKKFGF